MKYVTRLLILLFSLGFVGCADFEVHPPAPGEAGSDDDGGSQHDD